LETAAKKALAKWNEKMLAEWISVVKLMFMIASATKLFDSELHFFFLVIISPPPE